MRACLLIAALSTCVATVAAAEPRPDAPSVETSSAAVSLRLDPPAPRLGDLLAISIRDPDPTLTQVSAELVGYRFILFRVDPETLRGLVAIPIDIPHRSYRLTVDLPGRPLKSWVKIVDRPFKESELRVSKRFTRRKRSRKLRARLRRESRAWDELYKPAPGPFMFSGGITRPVQGRVTATFGTRRIFNGKTKSRHYGLDLDGERGDPIVAVQAGRVVMSAMRFTSGGTIVLDHGGGLFTAYFHMSRRLKSVGDVVEAGERLGDVGSTGRVTGPHLHLSVLVRMEQLREDRKPRPRALYVEPEAFLKMQMPTAAAFLDRGDR